MDEEELSNCQFVPFSTMEKVMKILETEQNIDYPLCKRNLYKLQSDKINPQRGKDKSAVKEIYQLALARAVYSHDWDKVVYLLKKSPITHHYSPAKRKIQDKLNVYIRALMLVFMYHPEARSKQLLPEYLHMVSTCRTEQEKRALMRAILTLPEKFKFMLIPSARRINVDDD
ncbi:uncharacterized protein LOC132902528 [Amyelois transitella]|uniref:uncharacterized protein LOC132902528 n=1 Tax=Amyelois transitella TaxID=680683 RepID=UPI0029900E93|nr:uncharacterized protein LOC132902528 [Amyelois transitella]